MTDPSMDAVLSRLDALECQNRRLKRWGACILVLGLATGGMAMAQEEKVPDVVRARRFDAVDGEGRTRAVLMAEPPGFRDPPSYTNGLVLCEADGEIRCALGIRDDKVSLMMTAGVDVEVEEETRIQPGRVLVTRVRPMDIGDGIGDVLWQADVKADHIRLEHGRGSRWTAESLSFEMDGKTLLKVPE